MMNCQACGEAVGREDRVCPKCGAALRTKRLHEADPPDPMIGTLIDHKYRIEKRIGAGGMAVVYQARREIIGDLVALKIMNSQLLSDSNAVARFRREAQAAARLKHPNVVSIHDFGISDRFGSYIVMEYVTGESLKSLIEKEGPFTPQRAANIAKQICAALQEAHRQNIVHRDVKPDNIIVDRNSERCDSKVLDFGIASLRDAAATSLTQTGSVLGTPYYMSPEQCMGEELDGRSDIYSVGVILYQMLTGILPFNSPSASAVIVQHVSQQPVSPRQHNPAIPEAVEAVVLRAMQKKRGDRQQTARELVRELEEAVAASGAPDRPISAVPAAGVVANHAESLPTVHVSASEYPTGGRPPEPPSQASSKPASRKLLLAAALGGLVTVAILGAVYVPSLVTDPGSDEKSEVEKKVVPVDPPIKTPPEVAKEATKKEKATPRVKTKEMIVADLLVQSERLFQRENFSEAAAKAAEALDIDGDNAQAHYYLGMSRYNLGEYEQSARSLIRAAALGQQVTFPVKHHHIDNGNDNFCSGSLILKSSRVTFRSDQGADHDFTVDRGKIVGLTQEPEKAGRLRVEVLIARRGREDRRTYIFHSPQAYLETLRMLGSSKSMVVANCRDCDGDVEFLFDLLRDE